MARYAVADVHGCIDALNRLLEDVKFSEDDVLYVIGDMIDRGPSSLEVLQFVRSHDNIIPLMGNHELMAIQYLEKDPEHGRDWMFNGNIEMLNWFESRLKGSDEEKRRAEEMLEWLRNLPFWLELDDFLLVHAGWNGWYRRNRKKRFETISAYMRRLEENDCMQLVWARAEFISCKTRLQKPVIFGHTPTYNIQDCARCECTVAHLGDKINIDCGCVYGGSLALMNLDTMEAVYTRETELKKK